MKIITIIKNNKSNYNHNNIKIITISKSMQIKQYNLSM